MVINGRRISILIYLYIILVYAVFDGLVETHRVVYWDTHCIHFAQTKSN